MAKTVAICDTCWKLQRGKWKPVRIREPDEETCHYCEKPTRSGIYVRSEAK